MSIRNLWLASTWAEIIVGRGEFSHMVQDCIRRGVELPPDDPVHIIMLRGTPAQYVKEITQQQAIELIEFALAPENRKWLRALRKRAERDNG